MNKLPNVIYIQIDLDWTPDDGCSPLAGATHNAERIHTSDVKYIRANLPVDQARAMVTKEEIKEILERHFLNRPLSYNPLRHLDIAAEAIAALPIDRVQAMAALVHYNSGDYNVPGIGTLNLVWEADNELHCDCNAPGCEHIQAVELHREQRGAQ